ncbi:MAG: hypothetical protein KDH92_09265, partial [Chloroflexi bacterium]|nr:hypothetical protein [Chloroflexota bacterium]
MTPKPRAAAGWATAQRHPRLLVAGLTLLALLIRAWDVDHMSLWQDEGLTLYRAGLDLPGILSGAIPLDALLTRDVQPPLYFLLLAAWLRGLGLTVSTPGAIWAGKWLSLLVSLPQVGLTWALARRLLRPRPAGPLPGARAGSSADARLAIPLLAALLAALSPALLWYAQELRSYSLQVSLGLASVYALLRALEAWGSGATADPDAARDKAPRRRAAGWALLCVLCGAALVWTHYLSVFLLAFEGLVVLAYGARRRDWRALAPLLALGLAAAPLLPYALWRLGLGPERDQRFVPLATLLRDVTLGFGFGKSAPGWSLAAPGRHLGMLAAELAFAGLLLAGAAWLWQRHGRGLALLALGYLLVPVLGLYGLTWLKPVYMGVRHILLAIPAAWLLAAAGGWGLEQRRRGLGLALLLLAGLGMSASVQGYYGDPSLAKDDHRALAAYLRAHAVTASEGARGDLLAVSHPVLRYTYQPLLPDLDILALPPFLASGLPDERPPAELLEPLLARYDRIWFVDPPADYEAWLAEHLIEVDRVDFPASSIVLDLHAYEPAPDLAGPEAPTRRQNQRLGGLELLGWQALPEPLVAGQGGRLRLVWKVAERDLPDYKVAFELLDAAGENVADGDHAPFHGLRPTRGWDFGTLVYEPHDLRVSAGAPAGEYRLTARVYEPESGAVHPAEGPIELGSLVLRAPARPPARASLPIGRPLLARGRGLDILGYDLAPAPEAGWTAGERLPLAVWLRLGAPADPAPEAADARLRIELVDTWGRVRAEGRVAIPGYGQAAAAGQPRRLDASLDLPAEAGRYGLRLAL